MDCSVPIFKAALKERLQKDKDLADVQVSWGNPHPDAASDELIIIGNTEGQDREYTQALASSNERYEIEIIVSVVGPEQSDQQTLLERAYELRDAIDASMIAWRSEASKYDGIVGLILPGPSSDGEYIGDGFREASVRFNLTVTARTT